jgi:hypothetical protein
VPVRRFSIPGHATRRDFAIYIAVANRHDKAEVKLYVGKTGDNRDGCNPVISRAGNHFSFNDIHSQVRNKLGAPAYEFDFEYFYISFDPYDVADAARRAKVDLVNEMERQVNLLLQQHVPGDGGAVLMNPYRNARRLSLEEREARARLALPEHIEAAKELVQAAVQHVSGLRASANNTMDPTAASGRG